MHALADVDAVPTSRPCSGAMPSSSCQPPSDSGAATPTPCSRSRSAGWQRLAQLAQPLVDRRRTACRGRGSRSSSDRRSRTWPAKSTSSMSMLRRPILMPMENAPSGFSAIGTEGWPTLPRTGSSLRTRPSASSRAMMICTVCAVRCVSRAISALRQAAVQADRLQHHALVELAHADLVGAARRAAACRGAWRYCGAWQAVPQTQRRRSRPS